MKPLLHYESNCTFVLVEINNPTAMTVVVQPKQISCELQQVQIDGKSNSLEMNDESFISQLDLSTTSLSEEQWSQVRFLLSEYRDIFSEGEFDIGHTDAIKPKIDLLYHTPFKQRHRRLPLAMYEEVKITSNSHLIKASFRRPLVLSHELWC